MNLMPLFLFDDVQKSVTHLATPRTFAHSTEKQGFALLYGLGSADLRGHFSIQFSYALPKIHSVN